MPKTKTFLDSEDVPTRKDVIDTIERAETPRDKALIAVSFITGGRIGEVLDLQKENIEQRIINGRNYYLFKILTEKNPTKHRRWLPIPGDEPLLKYVFDYMPERGRVFNITRQWAWVQIRKASNKTMWPHLLRHIRLTELTTKHGFSGAQLVRWAGWTDSRPEKHYLHLRVEDILPI